MSSGTSPPPPPHTEEVTANAPPIPDQVPAVQDLKSEDFRLLLVEAAKIGDLGEVRRFLGKVDDINGYSEKNIEEPTIKGMPGRIDDYEQQRKPRFILTALQSAARWGH